MVERVALLSDIHGNRYALDAVLAQLESERIDRVICLGDVAIFGPQPGEALARVRGLACPVVMGNTDAWALDPKPHPFRDEETERFNAVELWGASQLGADDRAFIRTFQPVIEEIFADGTTLCCYHGSPRSFDDPIRSTTPDEELVTMLDGRSATIMAGGHTHVQMVRRLNNMLIINPGSVGLPFEIGPDGTGVVNPPWAEYAVLSASDSTVAVELRRVTYDVEPLIAATVASGMPHADWWTNDWR